LRPGVKKVKSIEDMHRKVSFLRRFYDRDDISPLRESNGQPSRYAKAAHAWGEPIPKTKSDVKRLALKGERLLRRYRKRQRA